MTQGRLSGGRTPSKSGHLVFGGLCGAGRRSGDEPPRGSEPSSLRSRPMSEMVESRIGAVAWGLWPTPRFLSHRVAGGSCPPPAPTERSMRIYRTTLFDSWFTALQEPATPHMGGVALVSVTASVL